MSTTSTSVCQNLHSCLESLSSDLTHQLTPSKQSLSFLWRAEIENSKTEQVYVHPLVKRSSSTLSTKSLEVCTESLGCETGNNIVSDHDNFSYHAFMEKRGFSKNKPAKNRELAKKIIKKTNNFPPPLTSISGNEGVQVRTHREGGRLVIKAFSFPYGGNCFQAERQNGRLKLSLVKDGFKDNEVELGKNEDEEEEEESFNGVEREYCENGGDEDEADFNGGYWGEDNLRDDGGRVGCKINGGDWSGGGRCNEERSRGSGRLPRLPYCVAIS